MKGTRGAFDRSFFQKGLHILVLFAVAVAYPSFQILTGSRTFFIAGKYVGTDLVFLAVGLCLILPLCLVFLEWILGHRNIAGRTAHLVFVFLLISAIVLPGLKKLVNWPSAGMVAVTFSLAGGLTALYVRFEAARFAITLLIPLVFVIPAFFLFDDRINKIVWDQPETTATPVVFQPSNPVVVVIFDELPLNSLLDQQGKIDAARFPNFAAITAHATWYRNATTVSDNTIFAVPAILTGMYPQAEKLPIRIDHPQNMFSLFENSYESHAYESSSKFSRMVKRNSGRDFHKRSLKLFSDLSAVYLHFLLPYGVAKRLPPVNQTWGNYWQLLGVEVANTRNSQDDRSIQFRRFISSIRRSQKPGFYFLHSMLPHVPWQHFASGRQYNGQGMGSLGIDGCTADAWLRNPAVVEFALQRHLIQVEFTDRLLGNLVDRLKKQELYNRTLIVITSDHGACFHSGEVRRRITERHYSDVMRVPLFIKSPYQRKSSINDSNAQTIDIFPTIVDILRIDCGWKFDGRSLVGDSPEPHLKIAYSRGRRFQFPFQKQATASDLEPSSEIVNRRNSTPVGTHLTELKDAGNSPIEVHLHNADAFHHIRTDSMFIPALITAHMDSQNVPKDGVFGVVVNGVVRSTAQPFQFDDRTAYVSSLVPESAFRTGSNDIEIVILFNGGKEFQRPKIIREKGQPVAF